MAMVKRTDKPPTPLDYMALYASPRQRGIWIAVIFSFICGLVPLVGIVALNSDRGDPFPFLAFLVFGASAVCVILGLVCGGWALIATSRGQSLRSMAIAAVIVNILWSILFIILLILAPT